MKNKIIILMMMAIMLLMMTGCEEQDAIEANVGNVESKLSPVSEVKEEKPDGTIEVDGDISVDDQLQKLVDERPERLKMYEFITLKEYEQKKENDESFLIVWTSKLCEACQLYKPVVFQYINNSPTYKMYYMEVSAAYPEGKEYFNSLKYEGTPTTEFYIEGELKAGEAGLMDLALLEEFIVKNIK